MLSFEEKGLGVTEDTKRVCIEIFGFFPYAVVENVKLFLQKDLGFEKDECEETYSVSGGGTADIAYLLPMEFDSVETAENFILGAIRNSNYVNKAMFEEISFLDADKVNKEMDKRKKNIKDREEAMSIIKKEGQIFCNNLKEKYPDNEHLERILSDLKWGVFV